MVQKKRRVTEFQKKIIIASAIVGTMMIAIMGLYRPSSSQPVLVRSEEHVITPTRSAQEQAIISLIQSQSNTASDENSDTDEVESSRGQSTNNQCIPLGDRPLLTDIKAGCQVDAPPGDFQTYAMAACSAMCAVPESKNIEELRNEEQTHPTCSGYTSLAGTVNAKCTPIDGGETQGNVDIMTQTLSFPSNTINTFHVKTNENIYFQCFGFAQVVRTWSQDLSHIPMGGVGRPNEYIGNQAVASQHGFTYKPLAECIDSLEPGALAYAIWTGHIAAMTVDKDGSGNALIHLCEANYDWCGSTQCRTIDPPGSGIVGCLVSQ